MALQNFYLSCFLLHIFFTQLPTVTIFTSQFQFLLVLLVLNYYTPTNINEIRPQNKNTNPVLFVLNTIVIESLHSLRLPLNASFCLLNVNTMGLLNKLMV